MWSDYTYIHANDKVDRIRIISTAKTNYPEYNISDDEIKLSAWILTDGHIDKHGYIRLYQSKEKNIQEINDLLNNLNYEYTMRIRNRNIDEICGKTLITIKPQCEFYVNAGSSREIHKYINKKVELPVWVYELSQRQFDIFLSTLILGDGSVYNRGNYSMILYGSEEFLKNVQGVCVTKGYTTTLVFDTRKNPKLNICRNKTIEFDRYKVISEKYYSGDVWCIVTPLTNFMVRQNGTCFFTGNCWALQWMRDGSEYPLWWNRGGRATAQSYDFDYKNVPKRHIDFLAHSIPYYIDNKNRIFVHGGFDPLFTCRRPVY